MAGVSGFPVRAEGVFSLMQKERLERFFNELAPRLETARVLDRELDRNLARKFNVLDYLRTNELGLSRIIADLLDPKGSHGQGVLFLRILLEKLEDFRETLRWPDLHATSVRCEEKITEGRIDVEVRIKGPGGETHRLVLENKPYAHDQESQVERYLENFGKDDRFLLIYLSPRGEGPSEVSVPKDKLREWRDHFAIMPYVGAQEEQGDGFDEYRLSHSLANWLGECRKDCEVDRLRWFLADMERFCQGRFGGQAMSTDCEAKAVEEFVLLDQDKWKIARAVSETWPRIRTEVCRDFFGRVVCTIRTKVQEICPDVEWVECDDGGRGEGQRKNWIQLYRESWAKYEHGEVPLRNNILLMNEERGPNAWCIGICGPVNPGRMTPEEQMRRKRLEAALECALGAVAETKSMNWWPWCKRVDRKYRNWESLVPDLYKENQAHKEGKKDGPITSYFVEEFIKIAKVAVPIIDDIEGPGRA